MTDTFSYSTDQERYTGEFETRAAAIAEAMDDVEDGVQFWTGRNIPAVVRYPDANWAVEYMQEQAYDDAGEIAETFLDGVTKEQLKELNDALRTMLEAWLDRHRLTPAYFTVEDVETHVRPLAPVPEPSP